MPTAAAPEPALLDRQHRDLTLGAVALVGLYGFESIAVATAMPTVAQALHGLPLYALAFGGTLAASVVGMVLGGRWSDLRGPVPALRHSIVWFCVGLLIAGCAPTMWALLVGRVVQGFGGGLMSVALYVVVGRVYPPRLHPRIFAAFAAAWVVPAVIGPVVAGVIVQHVGWRWVFLSVPAIALLAAWRVFPAVRALGPPVHDDVVPEIPHRLAWAVGAAASVLLLHYAGQQHTALSLPMMLAAIVALGVCGWHLLPRGTLRAARGLPTVIAMRGIASAAFFGTEVFVPLLLSRERGLSPTAAGFALTVGALGWSLGSWYRGRPAQPFAPHQVLRIGMLLILVGVVCVALTVSPRVPVAVGIFGWAVSGLGMGALFPTLSVLTLALSPKAQQGTNASALQLGDALFTSTVLALGGALFAALLVRAPAFAYLAGFTTSALLAVLGAVLAPRVVARPA